MRPALSKTYLAVLVLLWAALAVSSPAETVSLAGSGPLAAKDASEVVRKAVGESGYRVTLDDGWTADFWFARELPTSAAANAGAIYPQLANGEFVGVASFPKGSSDFRGQAIPAGLYTLRYQYIPQDANHMGVSPNPDFLLAVPIASDDKPKETLPFERLVRLSAKTTGSAHPAVIALAPPTAPSLTKDDQHMTIFTVPLTTNSGKTLNLGIILRGQANQ
jgi:hypothetical protein